MISGNNRPPSADGKPGDGRRSIFRDKAVRHYLEGREKEVLPQFVSPRSFLLLWALFVLLLVVVGSVAYFIKTPVYASGPAVVLDQKDVTYGSDGPVVAAFLPSEYLDSLREGQKLLLQLDPAGERLVRPVASIEPEVLSPDAARERFDLDGGQEEVITRPAAVVTAPLPNTLDASKHDGGVYRADVEVGSRRAISLFPMTGARREDGQ